MSREGKEREPFGSRDAERWRCDVCYAHNHKSAGSCKNCKAERGLTFLAIFGAFGNKDALEKYLADSEAARDKSDEETKDGGEGSTRLPTTLPASLPARPRRTLPLAGPIDDDEEWLTWPAEATSVSSQRPVMGRSFDDAPTESKHPRPTRAPLTKGNAHRRARTGSAKICQERLEEAASTFEMAMPDVVDLTQEKSDESDDCQPDEKKSDESDDCQPGEKKSDGEPETCEPCADGDIGYEDVARDGVDWKAAAKDMPRINATGGDGYGLARSVWKCDVCFECNPHAMTTCKACTTPFGRTFEEEVKRERDARKLAVASAVSTVLSRGSSAQDKRGARKCDVCRHTFSAVSAVCTSCGSEKQEDKQELEAPPEVSIGVSLVARRDRGTEATSTETMRPVSKSAETFRKEAQPHANPQRTTSPSPPAKSSLSRSRKPREVSTRRVSPVPTNRTQPQFMNARWPYSIASLRHMFNPFNIRFTFESPFAGTCLCTDPCRFDTCRNAALGIFCAPNCCRHNGGCGNTIKELEDLQLVRRRGTRQFAVLASNPIDSGVIIGEYLGQMCSEEQETDLELPTPQNEYKFKLKREARSHPRMHIYIDAERFGSITRFLNHSCSPATTFHEMRNGNKHTVVVVTTRPIRTGEEITVNYGRNLWFTCMCGEPNCCHKHIQAGKK